jgi:hypothetical protein
MNVEQTKANVVNTALVGETRRGLAWKPALLLGALVFAVYSFNGREIPNGDTVPAKLLPVAILRGDGPFLDRFSQELIPDQEPGEPLPYFVAWKRGRLVSTYPLGTALIALPFYLPQVAVLDWRNPGWDRWALPLTAARMAKNTAAALGSLTAVVIYLLLRRLELGRLAWTTAFATALAANLWADSQSLWQQVPAALALTVSLLLLVRAPVSRQRLFLAGLAAAALVWIRPQDVILAAAIFLWVTWHQPRDLLWFVCLPVLLGGTLVAYNVWFFEALMGGYANMSGSEYMTFRIASLSEAIAGNLWSPRRGLFLYCPWIALALATLPAFAGQLKRWSIILWLLAALVPHVFLYSGNAGWWGGHYFGPRYFTDLVPVFAVLLGLGVAWSWTNCRPVFGAFVITLVFAAGVQLAGALWYPSSWESSPVDIDVTMEAGNSERAWDWRDQELTRLLAERARNFEGQEWWLNGFSGYRPAPKILPVYSPGTRIAFTQLASVNYLQGIWYSPDQEWRWSGREVAIGFRLKRLQPLCLRMLAITYGPQQVIIRLNGHEVGIVPMTGDDLELKVIDLPEEAVRESNTLQLSMPEARSPKRTGENAEDPHMLGIGIAWMEFAAQPVYRPGTRIDFTHAGCATYLRGVWHGLEPTLQWSGREGAVRFCLEHVQPLRLRMLANTFGKQRVIVRFNGHEIQALQKSGDDMELTEIDLPPDAVRESNILELCMPDAKSPQSVGDGDDGRVLGIGVAWLEFQPLS